MVLLLAVLGCAQEEKKDASPEEQLIKACLHGSAREVREALRNGADVNRPHFGPGGVTPLMFAAAKNRDPGVIQALIAAGADVNAKSASGETVLMYAVRYNGSLPVLDALLAAGPALDAQDWKGETALHKVFGNKRDAAVAERLILAGANGKIESGTRSSAYRIAWINGYFEQSPLLAKSDPETFAEYSRYQEERTQREEQKRAEEEAGGGEDWKAPDLYEKYGDEPGVLPREARELSPVSESVGIDLTPFTVDNPDNVLPVLDEPSSFAPLSEIEMPVIDGALGTFPLYSAFAKACYGGVTDASGKPVALSDSVVRFNNTQGAFYRVVWRDVDIFFGMEPGRGQKSFAEKTFKRELVYTPLSWEAFVFFVNKDNPVDSLTVAQLQGIYSGKIRNWKEVGGPDMEILAFQRNEDSGSQSGLERFMGDIPLMEPLAELEYDSMTGIFTEVATYRNAPGAIGFSYYFFSSRLVNSEGVKLLSVNGVAPSTEHIRDKSYPLRVYRYAVTLKDNAKPAVAEFLKWMQGPQGQEIVKKLGYVGLDE